MISKTKIKSRVRRKTNPEIAETIALALKNPSWREVAKILSSSTSKYSSVNLEDIEKQTKIGETVVVPGKVLGVGNVSKKVRIAALSISETALSELKNTKSEFVIILDEIKKNPKAEGVKLVR